MRQKIYTKTGDTGQTSLIGGTRVTKNAPPIEAYGTVDELNAFIGWLSTYPLEQKHVDLLQTIQHKLFNIGSNLATDLSKLPRTISTVISDEDIALLESEIDTLEGQLPPLQNFVLPGGSASGSLAHVCRTVTRRAERTVLNLTNYDTQVLKYLNRLSDFFFVFSRYLTINECHTEYYWKK